MYTNKIFKKVERSIILFSAITFLGLSIFGVYKGIYPPVIMSAIFSFMLWIEYFYPSR